MTDLVVVEEFSILAQQPDDSVLVEQVESVEIVAVAEQGPPGPPGPPGQIGDAGGALLAANRLSEFAADPAAQADAQQNIGLGVVDPLAYYILAKA